MTEQTHRSIPAGLLIRKVIQEIYKLLYALLLHTETVSNISFSIMNKYLLLISTIRRCYNELIKRTTHIFNYLNLHQQLFYSLSTMYYCYLDIHTMFILSHTQIIKKKANIRICQKSKSRLAQLLLMMLIEGTYIHRPTLLNKTKCVGNTLFVIVNMDIIAVIFYYSATTYVWEVCSHRTILPSSKKIQKKIFNGLQVISSALFWHVATSSLVTHLKESNKKCNLLQCSKHNNEDVN